MLKDKVIFIAGGAGLIGRSLTSEFLRQGASVIIGDIAAGKDDQLFQKTAALVGTRNFKLLQHEINSRDSINRSIAESLEHFNRIDAYINCTYPKNANFGRSFFDVEYADFCENISLHIGGYFLAMQQFGQYFLDNGGGTILNFASIYGVIAPKFEIYEGTSMTMAVEYAAMKSAIIHLTSYAAKLFKDKNIRINAISPGGILDNQPESFLQKYKANCVSKGMLNPGDIAGTAAFLLSDAAKYITGQNIVVDDGFTL